jgi:predicted nucleotidyltransferase
VSRLHIDHKDILKFAEDRVNLPKDKADEYRAQAKRLGERLEGYLADHPDFSLRRLMVAGSLAKGTALNSLNDIDVAVYISGSEAPTDIKDLLNYLAERLRKAFPNFKPEQVQPQTYSVTVSFVGTGLDVDVVPILYYGDKNWKGNLVSQDDGSFLETSIPMHLDFSKKRKSAHPRHYAQVVRLVKFWARRMKQEQEGFRFKSFMIELILAHLADQGVDFSDYPEALQHFFTYVARTNLKELIVFEDNYSATSVPASSHPVKIIDPVNSANNVAKLYTSSNASLISEAALDAGDAIDSALAATTKELTVYYWQKVFGPSFKG